MEIALLYEFEIRGEFRGFFDRWRAGLASPKVSTVAVLVMLMVDGNVVVASNGLSVYVGEFRSK